MTDAGEPGRLRRVLAPGAARPAARAPAAALLLLALACGAGPGEPERPAIGYEDLIASGRLASLADLAPAEERTCADETRFAVELPPGTEVRLKLELGSEPVLTVTACRPEEHRAAGRAIPPPAGDRPTPEPTLALEIRGAGGIATEASLDLGTVDWHERRTDLTVHARRTVELLVRIGGGGPLYVSDLHVRHRPSRAGGPGRGRRSSPPSVLLVSLDTLRADAVRPETMPALSAFARRAERWAPHYATASWTKPSHASLLTGYAPEAHGAIDLEDAIRPATPTLAERFAAAGYRTAGLVYECGWLDPKWGFARGFDEYRVVTWHGSAAARASVDWMTARADEPFFYFLHLFTPHSDHAVLPYEATGVDQTDVESRFGVSDYGCRDGVCASQLLRRLNEDLAPLQREPEILRYLYDRGVGTTDDVLAGLFRDLEASDLFDRLLIVITSDHGEAFFEHGRVLHTSLHREILEVPLLVKWPRGEHAGARRRRPSSAIDVAPTLLAAAGIDHRGLPGVPLHERPAIAPVFAGTTARAVLTPRYHAISSSEPRTGARGSETYAVEELYDLWADPRERRNLLATAAAPRRVPERFASLLRDHVRSSRELALAFEARSEPGGQDLVLTPAERRRLEALGYLD